MALPAIAPVIPGQFEVEEGGTQLRQLADWLITAGALTPRHWQGNLPAAIRKAIDHATKFSRPQPLAHFALHCTADWECETAYVNERYKAKLADEQKVGAFVLGINAGQPEIGTIGPILERIEKARRNHGRTILHVLDRGLNHCTRALTPWLGEGWCQMQYWRGEINEDYLVNELMDEARADEGNDEIKGLSDKELRAKVLEDYEIMTRADYLNQFPKWAVKSPRHPVSRLRPKLPIRNWPEIRQRTLELAALTAQTPDKLNDIGLSHRGCFEACPFLLRWRDDDDLTRVWDDVMNHYYEAGEAELDMNAAFVFWDAASLSHALDRLNWYLRLTQACENLLRALHIKFS